MSQDKMSLGHNVTGQNVTRTKCHMDKMSHGQNVIGQNVAGQNFTDKLLEKCHYVGLRDTKAKETVLHLAL